MPTADLSAPFLPFDRTANIIKQETRLGGKRWNVWNVLEHMEPLYMALVVLYGVIRKKNAAVALPATSNDFTSEVAQRDA